MIKGTIQQEDTTIINTYAPNMGAPKYTEQLLTDIKEETNSNTETVGDLNIPFTSMDGSPRQKINKEKVYRMLL